MALGNRLKKLRETRGWTQLYAAKRLEIPNQTLSNYERNFREPDTETLAKLADLYEVTVDFLLGRDEPQTEQPRKMIELEDLEAIFLEAQKRLSKETIDHYTDLFKLMLEREMEKEDKKDGNGEE